MTEKLKKLLIKTKQNEYDERHEIFYEQFIQIYGIYDNSIGVKDNIANKYNDAIDAIDTKDIKSRIIALVQEMYNEFDFAFELCDEYVNKLMSASKKSIEQNFEDFINNIQEIEIRKHYFIIELKSKPKNMLPYMSSKLPISIPRKYINEILECQIESAYPSNNGLYPHEILMLSYAPKMTSDNTKFPQFWQREYNIQNPQGIIDKLIKEGFIKKSKNYELTEKGKKELSQQEYVSYINKHKKEFSGLISDKYMDIWKMNAITKGKPNYPFQKELEKYSKGRKGN